MDEQLCAGDGGRFGAMALAGCSWLVDSRPKPWPKWLEWTTWPWFVLGANAIAAYTTSVVLVKTFSLIKIACADGKTRSLVAMAYLAWGFLAWELDGVDFAGVCDSGCGGLFLAELGDVAEEDLQEDVVRQLRIRCRSLQKHDNNTTKRELYGGSLGYESLRDWLKALEKAGELRRVGAAVSPVWRWRRLRDSAAKSGERDGRMCSVGLHCCLRMWWGIKARGQMNQLGSERRMRMALRLSRWTMWRNGSRRCCILRLRLALATFLGCRCWRRSVVSSRCVFQRQRMRKRSARKRFCGTCDVQVSGVGRRGRRWRAVYYASGDARSSEWEAECRDVSDAGV